MWAFLLLIPLLNNVLSFRIRADEKTRIKVYSSAHNAAGRSILPDEDYEDDFVGDDDDYDDYHPFFDDYEDNDRALTVCKESFTTERFTIGDHWYKCRVRLVYHNRGVNHRGSRIIWCRTNEDTLPSKLEGK